MPMGAFGPAAQRCAAGPPWFRTPEASVHRPLRRTGCRGRAPARRRRRRVSDPAVSHAPDRPSGWASGPPRFDDLAGRCSPDVPCRACPSMKLRREAFGEDRPRRPSRGRAAPSRGCSMKTAKRRVVRARDASPRARARSGHGHAPGRIARMPAAPVARLLRSPAERPGGSGQSACSSTARAALGEAHSRQPRRSSQVPQQQTAARSCRAGLRRRGLVGAEGPLVDPSGTFAHRPGRPGEVPQLPQHLARCPAGGRPRVFGA
jgi:hypothetical protein